MSATNSQPVTPVNGKSMFAKCVYSTTMNKQSRMYYNAGAFKLDQARVLNKKTVQEAKRIRSQAELFYAASARNRERVTAGKENVQPSGTQNFTPDRKAAIRARQALKKQLNCKKI